MVLISQGEGNILRRIDHILIAIVIHSFTYCYLLDVIKPDASDLIDLINLIGLTLGV